MLGIANVPAVCGLTASVAPLCLTPPKKIQVLGGGSHLPNLGDLTGVPVLFP